MGILINGDFVSLFRWEVPINAEEPGVGFARRKERIAD
jgi:hypothetical protein